MTIDIEMCSIRSLLDAKVEEQLQEKLSLAEKCPHHSILPTIIGPKRIFVGRHGEFIDFHDIQTFQDAMLFPHINWTCFCIECAKKNPTPGSFNKFGYGFCSQNSWRASLGNWNKACQRAWTRMIKKTLNGKDVC